MVKDIKITYKQDRRIFTLFCALALVKHNEFNNSSLKVNSQYLYIQEQLQKKYAFFYEQILSYFKRDHYIQYLIWILRHSDFPEFKLITKNKDSLQHPDSWFAGFDEVMKEFYFKANIEELWNNIQIKNDQVVKWYKQETKKTVQQIIGILKNNNLPFQEVCIIPNLLETIGAGCGPLISPIAYVVFGPTFRKEDDRDLIIHELLHSIINPLVDNDFKLKKVFNIFEKIYLKITTEESRKFYPVWQWVGYEYLVKMMHASIMDKKKREEYFKLENDWGFPKVEGFFIIYEDCKNLDLSFQEKLVCILEKISERYKNL